MTLLAVAAGLSSCGGEDSSQRGGSLRVLAGSDFQTLDPGAAYYQLDNMVMGATQRPLYSYKPTEIDKPAPDLADGSPTVSPDGRRVTVKIKPGVRFSPPVNREVTAADVKYAIERGATPAVANPYVATYFSDLAGLAEFQSGKARDISGIRIPDDQMVVFDLQQPVGALTAGALALPLTAPVPREYAERFDKGKVSSYAKHAVATGPYMLRNDSAGKVTGYKPGVSAELVRNPNWDSDTDYRPAHLDRIEFDLGNDVDVASRQVLRGSGLVSGDFSPTPAVIKEALREREDQITFTPGGNVDFMAINKTIPPLDDVNVRRAIAAIVDRNAMRLTQGGEVIGDVPTHYLPPGVPGFEESGGHEPTADYTRDPSGDQGVAAAYMKKAGYASGRYEGGQRLLMVGTRDAPYDKAAEVAANSLEKLGFDVDLRLVSSDAMYTNFCGVPKADVAFCPVVGWARDFNDPQTLIAGQFDGTQILPSGNTNWSQLDDPKINAAIAKGKRLPEGDARVDHWAGVDRAITGLAPVVPWLWRKQASLRSDDVDGVVNQQQLMWDLSHTALE